MKNYSARKFLDFFGSLLGAAKTVPRVSCARLIVLGVVTWCWHGVLAGLILACREGWGRGNVQARRLKAES